MEKILCFRIFNGVYFECVFYKKPYKTDSIYRSILFRKEFFDELIRLRDETGISFSRLVNGSIKDFFDKYDGRAFKVR